MHVVYLHFGYLESHMFFIIHCIFTTECAVFLSLVSTSLLWQLRKMESS